MPARYKYILLVIIFFISPLNIFASDVVINEFLPDLPSDLDEDMEEWVELYNKGDSRVDLNGWVLKDSYDNHELIIQNLSLEPKSFIVIKRNKSKFSLNNSNDDVRLFDSTASATPIDSFTYDKTYTNQSWGRIPDGFGGFINKLTPSPGSANQAPAPEPTPTPKTTTHKSSSVEDEKNDIEADSSANDNDSSKDYQDTHGIVAGYATYQEEISTHSSDLEINPIQSASKSATVAGVLDYKEVDEVSGGESKKPNFPIIVGSTLFSSGIVAILLKRYNISSRFNLWQKLKFKNS